MAEKPICFTLMPFGTKPDPTGRPAIDFNRVYVEAVEPAILDAGLEPIRADDGQSGGVLHKPTFESLLLCDYAVVDLTYAEGNVFYQLGVRQTMRPGTTLSICAHHRSMHFDADFLRAFSYDLGDDDAFPAKKTTALRTELARRLGELRERTSTEEAFGGPLLQRLGEWRPAELSRLKTDVFRERVPADEKTRARIDAAVALGKNRGLAALDAIRAQLVASAVEAALYVDLFLAYRALKAWTAMIDFFQEMPKPLQRQILVREQLAFALNRRAGAEKKPEDRERALDILEGIERHQGPSAETCALIGRIYKDCWDEARAGDEARAQGLLDLAIDAYLRGFCSDPRDAFPGINAINLLELKGDTAARKQRDKLIPVVRFAVKQRLHGNDADYWDHATLLELAVLGSDRRAAKKRLADALANVRMSWEPESTARTLDRIRELRASRNERTNWLDELIAELDKAAQA